MTGDASDELFGGYYSQTSFLLRTFLQNNIFTPKISSYLSKAIPFFKYLQFPKWDYILNPFNPDITEGPLNFSFLERTSSKRMERVLRGIQFFEKQNYS